MAGKRFKLVSGVAFGAFSVLGAGAAYAQSAPDAPVAAAGGTVQEVIVMAQKRAQSLQDVPISMAAISSETLQEQAILNLEGVNRMVPNAVIEHVGLFPMAAALSMRGIGYAGIESYTDPDVAVYTNGVYQARNATALSSTVDVESIEVLRGPQGTLYGRNAYAGAVALRTHRPSMDETEASASATWGNYGRWDAEVVGNVPIVEGKVAARLAARSHHFDGFYKNNGIIDSAGTVDQTLKGMSDGIPRSRTSTPRRC